MSPVITEVQAKKRGVAAVSIDGGDQPVLLPLDTVVLHHLREGTHLPPAEWRAVQTEGRRLLAVRRALEILAQRHKTERELATALARSFEPDEVQHAVERMRALGYLNDEAWAKSYVSSPRAADRGRTLLRHELGRRGVTDDVASSVVSEHDDRAAAREAARKRARSLRRIEEPRRTRRLYDFLRRRGFADPVARDAAREALASLDAEVAGLAEGDPEERDQPGGFGED